jgi:1-acyl-sn-glycerol-3-phosphate acyltransferase
LIKIIQSVILWAIIGFLTIFLGIAAIAVSFFDKKKVLAQKIAKIWGKSILKVSRAAVSISGLENIDLNESYLILSNHQSYFDIFALLAYLPLNFRFVAKKSLFNIPVLGFAMKRIGYIPIDRNNMKSAFNTIQNTKEFLNDMPLPVSILIFPEGTRSGDGNLNEFKKGGINMFVKNMHAKIKIMPVAISGSIDILKKGSFIINTGKTVKINIIKPINLKDKDDKDIDSANKSDVSDISEIIHKMIKDAL